MKEQNRIVEVCGSCGCASCWHGEFMCNDAKTASSTLVTVAQLDNRAIENKEHYSKERIFKFCGVVAPHGYENKSYINGLLGGSGGDGNGVVRNGVLSPISRGDLGNATSYDTTKDPRVKNKSDSSVYVVQLSCGGEEFENIGAFGTKEIAEKYCFNSGVGSEDTATYSITEFELQNTQSIQSNAISRCWIYTAKDLKEADKATANNKCEVHNCAENAMCVVNDIKEVVRSEYRTFKIESTHYFCNAHRRDSITYDLKDW